MGGEQAAQAPVLLGGHAEATGLAEVSHYLPHLGAVALEEVEQQALEVGRDLDVHGRRDGRADAADGHGAAVEEAGQDVVAVGADDELGHRQANAAGAIGGVDVAERSEEHTSELQSLMRISYAVFCLKQKIKNKHNPHT